MEIDRQLRSRQARIGRARENGSDRDGAIEAYSRALESNPWYGEPAELIRDLEGPAE
jgi:hypothetical protein